MIIPGKKRPAGTFVPYVIIVQKYQTATNIIISYQSIETCVYRIFLIIAPSPDQNKAASGLNYPLGHHARYLTLSDKNKGSTISSHDFTLPTKYGTQKKEEAVMKEKSQVSTGFIHFLVKIFPLNTAILVLTLINNGPKSPPITPRTMAGKIRYIVLISVTTSAVPIFKDAPFQCV